MRVRERRGNGYNLRNLRLYYKCLPYPNGVQVDVVTEDPNRWWNGGGFDAMFGNNTSGSRAHVAAGGDGAPADEPIQTTTTTTTTTIIISICFLAM